jgi:cell division protein FtsN
MAQKKRTRRRSSGKGGRSSALHSLLWYVLGLVLGLAVLLPLLFWSSGDSRDTGDGPQPSESRDRPQQGTAPATPSPDEPAADPSEQSSPRQPPPAPRQSADDTGDDEPARPQAEAKEDGGYRFYTLLPEMEVEVPEPAPEKDTSPDKPAPDQPSASPDAPSPDAPLPEAEETGRFLVQVAAFRQRSAAEDLKARLAMRGLQASVVSADLGERGTWHRVRLGPYPGRGEAERVRDRLADDGMQGMVVRK